MDASGYQSAATGGAPSTVISSSEAPSFGSGATGTSWSSYDSALAEHASATATTATAIPEEQEEEEEPASPDKPFNSSKSGRPAPGTTRRTRATLVCAECKRLKLQCDRKRPHCSKCIDRKCTHLCTYSEASQGKIDLVALNNRLIIVEEAQQKISRERHDKVPSGGWTLPFAHIDRERETQTLQRKSDSALLVEDTLLAVSRQHGATLAVHHSGPTEIWFNDLNFSSSLVRGNGMHAYRTVLRPHRGQYKSMSFLDFLQRYPQLLSRDTPLSARRSTSALTSPREDLMSDDASVVSEDEDEDDAPKVEAKWVALLPQSQETRKLIYEELELGQRFHDAPSINVRWLRNRVEAMFAWVERMANGGNDGAGTTASASSSIRRKRVKKKNTIPTGNDEPAPTLSFFAAAAAAIAVGAQLYLQKHGNIGTEMMDATGGGGAGGIAAKGAAGTSSSSGSSNATVLGNDAVRARSKSPLVPTSAYHSPSSSTPTRDGGELGISDELHETLIHASKLALIFHSEQSGHATYDTDYIYALVLHAHYLLQFEAKQRPAANTGKKGKGKGKRKAPASTAPSDNGEESSNSFTQLPSMHPELPHVLGELVTSSRLMGLDHEGDSLSNDLFTDFSREMRRRLWWEIVVLDWIVNSNLNKPCYINDNDHTTSLPSVLDESQLYETSLSKLPKAKDSSSLDTIAFFLMKCTFTQTMKAMKGSSPYHDDDDKLGANASQKEQIDVTDDKIARITEWAASIPDKMQPENLEVALADFNKEVSDPPPPPMSSLQPPDESEMLVDSIPGMSRLPVPAKPSARIIELASRLAQTCVLSLRENHAKVKFYTPLVKAMPAAKHAASVDIGASKALAAMDPARLVIEVSEILVKSLQYVLMAKFMKYSFGRFIFDAAVILAHIGICAPANGPAIIGNIETAINILSNAHLIRGFQGNIEQGRDSVRILNALLKKARAAIEAHSSRFTIGNKRKREEEESRPEPFIGTFHIPFIGAGVKCIGVRKVAGEIPEQEAHGVTHPRILPEETQPPVASSSRHHPAPCVQPTRETSSQKSASLVESSSSSSSGTKRRKTEGVTIRSRIMDKPKRDGEHRRSSTTSRRQSAAPLTSRPRADSVVSTPGPSAPQSVVSEPLPQQTYSLLDSVQSSSRAPAPIQTGVRSVSSDIQPVASPTHYMRPPSSLSQQVSPSQSVEYGHSRFDTRHVVPSHQSSSQPQRTLPNFGGQQYQQQFSQPLANSPMSQFGSPQSYQPPPLGQPEPQYPESNMGILPSQGVEGPTFHIPSPVHVSSNPSYAPGSQMLGMHSEQSMQGSSQQQQYYHHHSQAHPPMLYDLSHNHGEQQQQQQSQQQQQWMNSANAPPPGPGEWPGHSHQ